MNFMILIHFINIQTTHFKSYFGKNENINDTDLICKVCFLVSSFPLYLPLYLIFHFIFHFTFHFTYHFKSPHQIHTQAYYPNAVTIRIQKLELYEITSGSGNKRDDMIDSGWGQIALPSQIFPQVVSLHLPFGCIAFSFLSFLLSFLSFLSYSPRYLFLIFLSFFLTFSLNFSFQPKFITIVSSLLFYHLNYLKNIKLHCYFGWTTRCHLRDFNEHY
jgi:hypothetical protein